MMAAAPQVCVVGCIYLAWCSCVRVAHCPPRHTCSTVNDVRTHNDHGAPLSGCHSGWLDEPLTVLYLDTHTYTQPNLITASLL